LLNTRQNNNNNNNNRRRGRGRSPQGGGNSNRQDNGSRIDNRARNNAPQMLEKYKNMARDAQTQGDRVMTEYYLQFADHYFRIVDETRVRYEEQRRQRGDWNAEGEEGEGGYNADADMGGDGDQDRQSNYQGNNQSNYQANNQDRQSNYQDRQSNAQDRQGSGPDRQGNAPDRQGNGQERQANNQDRPRRERTERPDRNERFGNGRGRRDEANGNEAEVSAEIDASVLPPSLGFASAMSETSAMPDAVPSDDVVNEAPVKAAPRARRPRRPVAEAEATEG
jgi:hypothetical protein